MRDLVTMATAAALTIAERNDFDRRDVQRDAAQPFEYLPPAKRPRARYVRDTWFRVAQPVELPEPRAKEVEQVARLDDDALLRALHASGPLTLHARSGVRQQSYAAAVVAEMVRRYQVPRNSNLAKRYALSGTPQDPCHRFAPGTGNEIERHTCKACGGDLRRPVRRTGRDRPGSMSKEHTVTTSNTPSKARSTRTPVKPGAPTPEQRDRAVAERKAAEKATKAPAAKKAPAKAPASKASTNGSTPVSDRTRARSERLERAKAAAKNGKDASKILAEPLPAKERKSTKGSTPKAERANAAVPAHLAPYRGNYAAPANMTEAAATKEAEGLSGEALAARLELMALKKGGFRTVQKDATLREAARRVGGASKPRTARKAPAKSTAKKAA